MRLPTIERLTKNKGDSSALPRSQHHEGMGQPLHEGSVSETVVAVVGVTVNWLGAHARKILRGNGREWHNAHLPVVRGRGGLNRLKRNKLGMIVDRVMFDGRVDFDGVEAEQFPETVCDLYRLVVLGVAWAATRLNGRVDLDAIQSTLSTNRRRSVFKVLVGWSDMISRRDYGKAKGHRIHAGCLEIHVSLRNRK